MWQTVFFMAAIPGLCLFLYGFLFLRSGGQLSVYLIIIISLAANLLVLMKYYQTLRFRPVPAMPAATDNIKLLLNFLQSNHFAFHQHPQAPEVFQILSRNISAVGEDREVMVFLADEGRILLNSHFIQGGTKVTMGTSHVREMAKDLKQFLAQKIDLSS